MSLVDLSKGFDKWVKSDDSIDNHLNGLLETIQAHEESLMNDESTKLADVNTKADIITWRGMMTKVRCYRNIFSWINYTDDASIDYDCPF